MNLERRTKTRYPVRLNVRYQTIGRPATFSGTGKTVDVSSGGVLIESQDEVAPGARLRVTMEWPTLLNGSTPLQLVTIGRVVRSEGLLFALAIEHYQFRTMRRDSPLSSKSASVAAVGTQIAPGRMSDGRSNPATSPADRSFAGRSMMAKARS